LSNSQIADVATALMKGDNCGGAKRPYIFHSSDSCVSGGCNSACDSGGNCAGAKLKRQ